VNILGPNRCIAPIVAFCLLACPTAWSQDADDMGGLFPDIASWTRDGAKAYYAPEDLFEYIDGAADLYLSYEFEELATLAYDGGAKRSLTVDIYRHSDLRNAFGIYSQEKPLEGNYVSIGTEGYYDTGVLNFFHGRYYVKLIGFDLQKEDEKILSDLARQIADRIGGEPEFPRALECFPADGKVARSERFIAQDVLGHGFLHAAYAADYRIDSSSVRVFIIEGKDDADANAMLEKYLELAREGGEVTADGDTWRFDDPRRSSAERFNLRSSGSYLWGLSANDDKTADRMLGLVEENLKSRGLIE
jgi:hypothetical protein